MAPPEGGAAEAPRDFAAELEESEGRLTEAERYLGLDTLLARRAELEAEAADPTVGRRRPRARGHHRAGSGDGRPRAADRAAQPSSVTPRRCWS
jgi:hypothetical protein